MDCKPFSLAEAVDELDRRAPDAPLLALGQTVLWDEPMKAGLALELARRGSPRKLIAGVHDTDYLSKHPSPDHSGKRFVALPHNDTTTRSLWSAAGEFSALFGSETVVSRHELTLHGANLDRVARRHPGLLDEATEAFGWRGLVSLDPVPPVVCELELEPILPELLAALKWAGDRTVQCVEPPERIEAGHKFDELMSIVQTTAASDVRTLADLYAELLPSLYSFASGAHTEIEVTRTSDLLQFNTHTCGRPRFEVLGAFLDPERSALAAEAYNSAVEGTEIYTLDRFGSGAVPFDVLIPGKGRGTLRLGNRSAIIMTPETQFVPLERPATSVFDLAKALESKFGPNCVVLGKAVTLISMLAREFVFVFHEGASGYVRHTAKFLRQMADRGIDLKVHPILRVRYSAWDALADCRLWFRLPDELQGPFGTGDLCAPSLASRWRQVKSEQTQLMATFAEIRRPLDLIRFLDERVGGAWNTLAQEYEAIHERLATISAEVSQERERRKETLEELKRLRTLRAQTEVQKGEHFRSHIFRREPEPERLEERRGFEGALKDLARDIEQARIDVRASLQRQRGVVRSDEVLQLHDRRRSIEIEAEVKRIRMLRQAVIASRGLESAGRRPSAWWFPVVCPSGTWFEKTWSTAELYWEPLSAPSASEKPKPTASTQGVVG